MTSKEKKSRKKYFKGLAIYTVILLILGAAFLCMAWFYVKEYETSQVQNVLDSYMENLNATKWNDKIYEASKPLVNDFQNEEDIQKAVKGYLNKGTITYKSAGIGDVIRYDLYINGQKIGTTGFSEDRTKTSIFKLYPWKLVEEEFSFDFLKSEDAFIMEIPKSYSLKVNGKDVDEQYITEKGIEYSSLQPFYSEIKELPTKVRYEIKNLAGDIEYEIFDVNGNSITYDEFKTDIQFAYDCSDEEQSQMKEFLENGFVESYVKFWGTKWVDTTYPTLMQYVKLNSRLHQDMYTYTLDAVTWIHYYQCTINSQQFNYAKSLGGGAYVISETVNSTSYAEYKTTNEESEIIVVVIKDPTTGEILAVDRA